MVYGINDLINNLKHDEKEFKCWLFIWYITIAHRNQPLKCHKCIQCKAGDTSSYEICEPGVTNCYVNFEKLKIF